MISLDYGVCTTLMKIVLPIFLIAACLFRYNGLSFVYLLFLLCIPLLQSPTAQSMKGATGKYLKLLVAFSTAACISHLIFQIVLLIDQPYGNFLENCTTTEQVLRQLGFQRLDVKALSSIRLIAPDIIVLLVSAIVLVACHKLLTQELSQQTTQTSQTGTTYKRKGRKRSIIIAGLRGLLTMILLAFAAIIEPSMISAVYFVSFLIVVTWWSLYKTTGKQFVYWQGCWMVFSGFHLILLYLYQFQFFQENVDYDGLAARLIGLKAVIKTDCNDVYELMVQDDLLWPAFVNPFAVLLLYWYCALEIRRWWEGPRNGYDQLSGQDGVELVEVPIRHPKKHHKKKSGERESSSSKKKLLVDEETRRSSPDYQTIDTQGTSGSFTQDESHRRHSRTGSDMSAAVEHPKASPLGTLVAYITKQSYIAALILMMAWSITYHSWLSFVLLLWACACWIIPGSRKCALYSSPFLVFYAECLIIIQFVYGLNLYDDELPVVTDDGVDLTEIGLQKYEVPCTVLAVKLLYTCMFWLTLRQFCREAKLRELDHHQAADGIILQPFGMIFSAPSDEVQALAERAQTGDQVDRVQSETMMIIGSAIMDLISKYWILLCGGMFLIVSLQDNVDCFKIVYMGLFLLLMTIFVFSWRLFRAVVYIFWWIVVLYSMIVLVLVYTYQFDKFPGYWQNATGLSEQALGDIGLQNFNISELFLNLLIPTSFIIVIVAQIHYFHGQFLKLSEIKKPRDGAYTETIDEPENNEDYINKDEVDAESQSKAKKSLKLYLAQLFKTSLAYYHKITSALWRVIEIHMMKVVFFTIIMVVCHEVSAVNCVFMFLMFFAIPVQSLQRLFCLIAISWASLVLLAKMIYQLSFIDVDEFYENCSAKNPYWEGDEIVNSTVWLGFKVPESQSFPNYVQGYVFIIIALIVNSIVILHQRQHYVEQGKPIPKDGVIFEGIKRENADEGLVNMLKFLANYGFYKYGLEISYIMIIITVCIRLDLFAIIYITFLLVMVFLDRKVVMVIWPIFLIVLSILLPVSYCLCLGLPPSFCVNYIWDLEDGGLNQQLITWLYLPTYDHPLNAKFIIADFFQLLFVSLQWQVFLRESKGNGGGDNNVAKDNFKDDAERIAHNPVPNFTFNKSYLDLCKNTILGYNFWVCLAVLYITATSHTNILGVGYLIIAFSCLGFGRNLLMKPMADAVKLWNLVILYNLCVVTMKVGLQILTCAYLDKVLYNDTCLCALIQLIGVVCLQHDYIPIDQGTCNCDLPEDESGLSWDIVCFCFLIVQKRIFTSYYFQYIVIDLQEEKKLASKGAELINEILATKVRHNKIAEAAILGKIKEKTEKIREKQMKVKNEDGYFEPKDHGEAIRGTAGYYMFVDESDDEISDLEEDSLEEYGQPEEPIPTTKLKRKNSITELERKQSPWQLAFSAFMTSPKTALENDEALSPTSATDPGLPIIEEERKDEPEGSLPSTSTTALESTGVGEGDETDVDRGTKSVDDALEEVVDDILDVIIDDEEEPGGCWDKFVSIMRLAWRIFLRLIDSAIAYLDKASEEYRYVAKELKRMSAEGKRRRSQKRVNLQHVVETEEESTTEEELAVRSPPRDDVTVTTVDAASGAKGGDFEESVDTSSSDKFENSMPRPVRLLNAIVYWGIAHSELICYFVIILNNLVSASILSLPLPILVFLWAMLTVPRPTKRFWITVITYTEIVVILKYIFQFQFYPWYQDASKQDDPLWWPRLIGIEKEDDYAVFDLIVLLAVFLHRSILRRHGLWQESRVLPDFHDVEVDNEESKTDKKDEEKAKESTPLAIKEKGEGDDDDTGSMISSGSEEEDKSSWLDPFKHFYQRLIDPTYSYVTDVYVTMFGCDFINFLITTFCSYAFGEEQAQTDVTEYILNNQIPLSFVLLLLIQFILILVDRAIYLKKNVTAKFIFLIVLVIAIHGWLFFLLPWMSNKQFTDNTPAQIFYFFKCLYFGLSAYQIRCGYPTRILGNFLTKTYNYVSLFLFYGWQLIPFLMEIRIVMDWMFTATTLSIVHWIECEDIYADCFITKCWRKMEKKYPVARGVAKSSLVKYGSGGVMLCALVLIIWFPLLFISFVNTSSIPNPPSIATAQIQIAGFEPIFDMNSQDVNIMVMPSNEYQKFRDQQEYKSSLEAQSFFNQYQSDDVYIIKFMGESSSTWDISPPGRVELRQFLEGTSNVSVKFTYTFTRQTTSTLVTQTVGNSHTINLPTDDENRVKLVKMLNFTPTGYPVFINLFPPYVKVPATGTVSPVDVLLNETAGIEDYTDVSAKLVKGNISNLVGEREWWSVEDDACTQGTQECNYLKIITFNDRVASDVFAPVSSYGVIGLYVSLVLVIGRFVRMYFSGIRYQIMFNELPDVDRILRLCLDIFLVRECQEMALEEDLMAKLIFLYRSPETLIRFTKYKRD